MKNSFAKLRSNPIKNCNDIDSEIEIEEFEMTDFTKTPGWLDWYQGPSKPQFKLPAGAIDSHCHVFGPSDVFPYSPERKYTPCDASKEQLFALPKTSLFKPLAMALTTGPSWMRSHTQAVKPEEWQRSNEM